MPSMYSQLISANPTRPFTLSGCCAHPVQKPLICSAKKLPGYSIVYPEDGSQKEEVMESVYGEQGIKRGNTGTYPRQLLKKAADKLVERGCELIVCGCTEVELALKQEDVSVPLIDPMQLMAERVTKRLAELNELEAPSSERQSIPHNRLTYTLPASS